MDAKKFKKFAKQFAAGGGEYNARKLFEEGMFPEFSTVNTICGELNLDEESGSDFTDRLVCNMVEMHRESNDEVMKAKLGVMIAVLLLRSRNSNTGGGHTVMNEVFVDSTMSDEDIKDMLKKKEVPPDIAKSVVDKIKQLKAKHGLFGGTETIDMAALDKEDPEPAKAASIVDQLLQNFGKN